MSLMQRTTVTKPKNAFTLIELLVVISIIALLISILLPALKQAHQAAQATVCLSQQRQLGVAMALYANEHDGYVPPAQDGTNAQLTDVWEWKISYYLGYLAKPSFALNPHPNFPVYRDPASPQDVYDPTPHLAGLIPTNYRYNCHLGNIGTAAWQYPAKSNMAPRKLANFTHPDAVVGLTDGNTNPAAGAPNLWVWVTWNYMNSNNGAVDVGRHHGAENYLYMDDHAAPGHMADLVRDQIEVSYDHVNYR